MNCGLLPISEEALSVSRQYLPQFLILMDAYSNH